MSLQSLTAFLLASLRFELRINGAPVSPDYIRVDPADGKIGWYFEFPANALAPGVYIFEGHWIRKPLDVSGCLAEFAPEDLAGESLLAGVESVKNCIVAVVVDP